MGYHSEDHGVNYINNYVDSSHSASLLCKHTVDKGRILIAQKNFQAGDIIFRESPLLIVAEKKNDWYKRLKTLQKNQDFDYEPLWYWAALNSLQPHEVPEGHQLLTITNDQQHRLLLLYHDEVQKPSDEILKIISEFNLPVEPLILEKLLQIWILNCFEHSEDPLGYATYFLSSFMSHSCYPNAVWHYDDDTFVLRARRRIEAGTEICCSYLSEDALLESTEARRTGLEESKHFICRCERCDANKDESRGFWCLGCHAGSIFPWNSEEQFRSALCCSKCERMVTNEEFDDMLEQEKKLDQRVTEWEKKSSKLGSNRGLEQSFVERVLEQAQSVFSQHWLLERLWGQASDYYEAIGELEKAVEYTKKRVAFFEKAYPSLSGAHAWACEILGDQLLKISDPVGACEVYERGRGILKLMFGEEHSYYLTIFYKHENAIKKAKQLQSGRNSGSTGDAKE